MRIMLAFRTFFQVLFNGVFAEKVASLAEPVPAPDPEIERRRRLADQLRLVSILQRDGRLLDFLAEDLKDYSDEQIGSAVREVHRDCKAALAKYVGIAPVVLEIEDAKIEVPAGFDPSRIRLSGNVKGQPPYRGTVVHRGWKAEKIELQDPSDAGDPTILAPAQVEII